MLHATAASNQPKISLTHTHTHTPLGVNKHASNVARRNGRAMNAVELQLN